MFGSLKTFKFPLPSVFSPFHVYFDLGTTNTRVAIKNKGVVLRESTYLGYNARTKEYTFFGKEAKTILGKTPDFIKIDRPIVNSILYDFDGAVSFLDYCVNKAIRPYLEQYRFIKPQLYAISTAPSIATEIEKKALEEALDKISFNQITVYEKALATASGCGFNIDSHEPRLIIDFGGGLIELSVVSGGGVVLQKSLKTAGENMDKLVANYTYLKHGIVLGESTCESIKINLLNFTTEEKMMSVRGKSLETGLPKTIKLKSSDVREALISQFHLVIDAVKELIETARPEIADAIFKNGIALAGSMAAVPGIDVFFTGELKIDTFVVEHYADATIFGQMKLDGEKS